jgi:SAM-dependent methyltransferase
MLPKVWAQLQEFDARLQAASQSLNARLADHGAHMDHRLQDTNATLAALSQQLNILTTEHASIIPPPPRHLQERVVGCYSPGFIASGASTYRSIQALLEKHGRSFGTFRTVLDFGCGCGRIIRAVSGAQPTIDVHGADIDVEAIEWLQQNYSNFGEFRCLPYRPPTSYDDHSFDFIYGISVFTHLPEDMQLEWLAELARIAKPGATLLLTTHGEKHWGKFSGEEAAIMSERGFYYREAGPTDGLPDFYKNTYHSHGYIRERWSQFLNIVDIVELGLEAHQDVVLATPREARNDTSPRIGQRSVAPTPPV